MVINLAKETLEIVHADGRRSSHSLGTRDDIGDSPIGPFVALSPDGRKLALKITATDLDDILQVWDLRTGERLLNVARDHLGSVFAWSADSQRLAVTLYGDEGDGYALFSVGG